MGDKKKRIVLLVLISLLSFFSGFLTGFLVHESCFNSEYLSNEILQDETDDNDFIKNERIKKLIENVDICPLKNSGVMCYFNSLIQCMYSSKELKEIFKNENTSKVETKNIIIELFERMNKKDSTIDTKKVMEKILSLNSSQEFKNSNMQQDIHSLYNFLVDSLLPEDLDTCVINSEKEFVEAVKADSIFDTLYFLEKQTSKYVGTNQSSIEYFLKNCVMRTVRFFNYNYQLIIDEYLKKNSVVIKATGQQQVDIIKEVDLEIVRFPKVLVFYSLFFDDICISYDEIRQEILIGNSIKYSLISIGFHSGNSNSGHYIAVRKIEKNLWAIINDNSVKYCHSKSLMIHLKKGRFKPTLAFFERA